MAGLYPTPTRLALLAAIRDGHVVREAGECWLYGGGKVTARVAELEAAGWVTWVADAWPGRERAWLTDAGYTVLRECGR